MITVADADKSIQIVHIVAELLTTELQFFNDMKFISDVIKEIKKNEEKAAQENSEFIIFINELNDSFEEMLKYIKLSPILIIANDYKDQAITKTNANAVISQLHEQVVKKKHL